LWVQLDQNQAAKTLNHRGKWRMTQTSCRFSDRFWRKT
jgi:hypothetical protein